MNPVAASVQAPKVPQVNLLPPEVEARRSRGRARAIILLALVAFVLLLAAAWWLAMTARQAAEAELQAEQDRRPQLMAELAEYDYIQGVEDMYQNSVNARMWAGGTDIEWATLFTALLDSVPADVQFTEVQVSQATPFSPGGDDGTVFGTPDMGAVTFVGRSLEPGLTAELTEQIDAIPGLHLTFIESKQIQTNGTAPYWEYSGATRITFNALSERVETEQTEVPADVLEALENSGLDTEDAEIAPGDGEDGS